MISSLHIGIKYQSGGEGRVFSELLHALPPAGCRFRGLVGGPNDTRERSGGQVIAFAKEGDSLVRRVVGIRRCFRNAIATERPDIIASHFALYALPTLHIAPEIPRVTHFHGPWAQESLAEGASAITGRVKQLIEQSAYRRSSQTIVLSQAFANLATDLYGIPPESVTIIPGAVDLERFDLRHTKVEAREMLNLPKDRRIILSVRRLVRRMGLTSLINAIPDVIKKIPDALFVIAGHGPLADQLKSQAHSLHVDKHLQFLGYVDEDLLAPLYRAADVNIVPTIALEGFGLVAAEALACGTPSLVTPVGGLSEVVAGLSLSLILESASTQSLSEGLVTFFMEVEKFPTPEQCSEYAIRCFAPNLMAKRTVEVYNRALS